MNKEDKITENNEVQQRWIIRILVGIICLCLVAFIAIFAIKLSDDTEIVNVISIGSGLVSMALAFVAIAYSMKQDLCTTIINNETQSLLNQINGNLDKLDIKVSGINTTNTEITKDIIASINSELVNYKKEFIERIDIILTKVNSSDDEIISEVNKVKEEFIKLTTKITRDLDKNKEDINMYEAVMDILHEMPKKSREIFLMKHGIGDYNGKERSILQISRDIGATNASIANEYKRAKQIIIRTGIDVDEFIEYAKGL